MDVIRFNGYEDIKNHDIIELSWLSYQKITYPEKITNLDYQLKPCSSDLEFSNSEQALKQATEIIKLADPDIFEVTEFIIDEIRIFSANNVRAGSGFNTLGMVYISELSKHDDVSIYIEHLIHESAHNLLYAYWGNEALIVDEAISFSLPLLGRTKDLWVLFIMRCLFYVGPSEFLIELNNTMQI